MNYRPTPAHPVPGNDLGTARLDLRGGVVAGSFVTCRLAYTAGFFGIDDTGSIKIALRFASDAGVPQFTDPTAPNYTTVTATNGAKLLARYDVKDNVRPWGKTVYIKVLQGYLAQGDRIEVTFGDTRAGSPGWRMQTFCEDTFELKVLVDPFATCVYQELPQSPVLRIVPGTPERLVAVAPSVVRPGQTFTIRARREDAWGNPAGRTFTKRHKGFREPGTYRIDLQDQKTGLACRTNPVLVSETAVPVFWADLHGQSEETIGSNTLEEYFAFARDKAFVDVAAHQGNDFQVTDSLYRRLERLTRRITKSGAFVAFPGYEWSGNTGLGGDRNVLFRDKGFVSRSCRALVPESEASVPDSPTAADLFRRLRGHEALVWAHVGGRYADLAQHDPDVEFGVEVHSAWGTFEWLLEDAFRLGYRVAVLANSDGHKGRPGASHPGASKFGSYGGLTAIRALKLNRNALWSALKDRRTYATTGARILLEVSTEGGHQPGDIVEASKPPVFHVAVHGTAPIENVQLRNGARVVKTHRVGDNGLPSRRIKLLWGGAQVRGRGRQVEWDGMLRLRGNHIVAYEPVNFHNIEKGCVRRGERGIEWQSITTGGHAGVILTLDAPEKGTLEFVTAVKRFSIPIGEIAAKPRAYRAGGLARQVAVYRLPEPNERLDLDLCFRPRALRSGDNPFYVRVEQEDGHLAWSTPIYVVGPG